MEASEAVGRGWSSSAKVGLGALAVLGAVFFLPGCVADTIAARSPREVANAVSPVAQEVNLKIDDAGAGWAAGAVGEALKLGLLKTGTFESVHYPISSATPTATTLKVVATAEQSTDAGSGFLKAVITGLFFFLPVGIIRYHEVFTVNASVAVIIRGQTQGTVDASSTVDVWHKLLSGPSSYVDPVRKAALEQLATAVSSELARHRDWFANVYP